MTNVIDFNGKNYTIYKDGRVEVNGDVVIKEGGYEAWEDKYYFTTVTTSYGNFTVNKQGQVSYSNGTVLLKDGGEEALKKWIGSQSQTVTYYDTSYTVYNNGTVTYSNGTTFLSLGGWEEAKSTIDESRAELPTGSFTYDSVSYYVYKNGSVESEDGETIV